MSSVYHIDWMGTSLVAPCVRDHLVVATARGGRGSNG